MVIIFHNTKTKIIQYKILFFVELMYPFTRYKKNGVSWRRYPSGEKPGVSS